LPGFADFAKGSTWDDIASAVEPATPVVYVNPTPFGTLILGIVKSDVGIMSAAQFIDLPTSLDLVLAMWVGDGDPSNSSYLGGVSGIDDDRLSFRRGLEHVLQVLGESIARPLAEWLRDVGATGATIVATGPIGRAPLHAATWASGTEQVSLLDLFDVRFTPSATLHSVCLRRARDWADDVPHLTALGNPDLGFPEGDLPAAEAEVCEIARHFGSRNVAVATRRDATRAFLVANAGHATHLHLACHAKSGLLDPEHAGVALADGWVPAVELARRGLRARLTVMSACETAVVELLELENEAFSLGSAFLAAGSASAVATLWPIDDAATALLMTRFYEELFSEHHPVQALRRAQLWLRDLNEAEETTYLAAHAQLEEAFRLRTERGRPPGLRSTSTMDIKKADESRPYSHPEFWAPFVIAGG